VERRNHESHKEMPSIEKKVALCELFLGKASHLLMLRDRIASLFINYK